MYSVKTLYCRLCAEPKSSDKLIDLELCVEKCRETTEMLIYLNAKDINISKGDSLPKTVCLLCQESLTKAFTFITNVYKAQTVLSNVFQSIKEESIEENNLSDDEGNDSYVEAFPQESDECFDKTEIKTELRPETDTSLQNPELIVIKVEKNVDTGSKDESQPSATTDVNLQDILSSATCPDKQWYGKEIMPSAGKSWKTYVWVCHHCGMEFPDQHTLRSHCKEVHGTCCGFSCVDCRVGYDTFDVFINHVRLHRKYLRHRCPYCDTTLEKGSSKLHKLEHCQPPQVACNVCGEILKDEDALSKHCLQYPVVKKIKKPRRKRGTPITLDELTCKVCKKVYKNKNSLRDHQKLHLKDRKRNFTCDRCGKAFYSKGSLTSHIMSHDQVRPHVCKICNKSFLFPNMLRRHVEMHSGVKPYSCEQCGRCFRLKYQLNSHKIIHTDEMPYICQFCSKTFRFKQILQNHERQHTGARPYSCDLCRMEFTNWSNYNKHMKRRHNTDTARKKITPVGVFPVNPLTGLIVEIEDPVATEEWKSKIMIPGKRGKKKKVKINEDS